MSSVTQYVVKKPIHFTTHKYYAKVSDLMMYQPPKATIYRLGKLVTSFNLSGSSVDALVKSGLLTHMAGAVAPVEESIPQSLSPVVEPELPKAAEPVKVPEPVAQTPEPELPKDKDPEPELPKDPIEAATAQILTAELGPDDDGSLPDGADATTEEPAVTEDLSAAEEPAAEDPAVKVATPRVSRRAKAAAAAATV